MTRLWKVFTTFRPTKGGWVNNMGLQNPGLRSRPFVAENVVSVAATHPGEWEEINAILPNAIPIEVNISCPNVYTQKLTPSDIQLLSSRYGRTTFKLQPSWGIDHVKWLVDNGAKSIHVYNTLKTPRGGESGDRLRNRSISMIKLCRRKFPKLHIVGGGGIYNCHHAMDYLHAGADQLSLATVWLNPFKAKYIMKKVTEKKLKWFV